MATLSNYTSRTTATPSEVYALWSNPASWGHWDPEVASVEFTDEVRLGASGTLYPTTGPKTSFTLTDLQPGKVFTNTSSFPGAWLDFIHEVAPVAGGSEITVTVQTRGLLSGVWGLILKRPMTSSAPASVKGAIAYLEAHG